MRLNSPLVAAQTGDICYLYGASKTIMVEVIEDDMIRLPDGTVRWHPLKGEYWTVKFLTGPGKGVITEVWCRDLTKVPPLTALALLSQK